MSLRSSGLRLLPSLRGAQATKQSTLRLRRHGLLRFARNDGGWRPRYAPGMTVGLHQPAAVGDAAQMIIGVAKGVLDHGQPLEVVADFGLLRHADAAMELDRLLADEFCG